MQRVASPVPMDFSERRTREVLRAKSQIQNGDVAGGTSALATAVLESALHVCKSADRALLRKLHGDMRLSATREMDPHHPLPCATWGETVLSEEAAQVLEAHSAALADEVRSVSRRLGDSLSSADLSTDEALKDNFLSFFVVCNPNPCPLWCGTPRARPSPSQSPSQAVLLELRGALREKIRSRGGAPRKASTPYEYSVREED